MQKKKIYIAYGSNLNLLQMKYRCPTAKVIGTSEIKDYELLFRGRKQSAVATIEPCKGSNVPVLLWNIHAKDELSLDRYEGYPSFYDKENININLNGKPVSAMVYVMIEGHHLGIPSEFYRKTIEEGYKSAGFDTDILQNAIDRTTEKMTQEQENTPKQEILFGLKLW